MKNMNAHSGGSVENGVSIGAFCVESIRHDAGLRATSGVLRATALAVTGDARIAGQRIVDAAQEKAEAILLHARQQAQEAVSAAEQQSLRQARVLLDAVAQLQENFLERGQDIVVDLAQALFDRLVLDMTPRERIEAALKRILCEAPSKLVGPLLRVHPDDIEQLPAVEWDVKADAGLAPGTCRLEAASGEWCVDFSAAVASLKAVFDEPAGEGVADARADV